MWITCPSHSITRRDIITRNPVKKNLWFWVVLGVVVVIMIIAAFAYRGAEPVPEPTAGEPADESLEQALEQATDVPDTNPLGERVPDVNPIERANPFSDVNINPFR